MVKVGSVEKAALEHQHLSYQRSKLSRGTSATREKACEGISPAAGPSLDLQYLQRPASST